MDVWLQSKINPSHESPPITPIYFACTNCTYGHGFRGQVVPAPSRTTQENDFLFFLAQGYMKHSSKFFKPSFLWRVSCHLPVTCNILAASKMDVWEYQSCHIISWDLMRDCGSRMHWIPGRIGRLLQIQFCNACREKYKFWKRKYL